MTFRDSATSDIINLCELSIIIPTRDRPADLANLLQTILNQQCTPIEVILVDDSLVGSAKSLADSFRIKFNLINCHLRYIRSFGVGLTAARNLGVRVSQGNALLFLDDDTLLCPDVVSALATFLRNTTNALGVQPKIIASCQLNHNLLAEKIENAVNKVLMLFYREDNTLSVRKSGMSILPNNLTKVIPAQRLSGCCCYAKRVFNEFSFDANLRRWGYMEDLDFSYRLYKKYPDSLYAIPSSRIIHKTSKISRLPTKLGVHMMIVYWFYVFFKDIFDNSIQNLLAFFWALSGNLSFITGTLIAKRKPKREWWTLIHTLTAYATALKNLKNIRMQKLDFFNKKL